MAPITHKDLQFNPLDGRPWINNAVVAVKQHFRLSVSKNRSKGMWYVGADDSYEVAVQACETLDGQGDLVTMSHGDNIKSDCDLETINRLAEEAEKLTYAGKIEVFDVADRSIHPDLQPRWLTRFYCAEGRDLEDKLKYSERIWGKERYRFIPVEILKTLK